MFSSQLKAKSTAFRIKLVTADTVLADRLKKEFIADKRSKLEVVARSVVDAATLPKLSANCSALVIDVDPRDINDTTALKIISTAVGGEVPIVIVSEDLGTDSARRLLHLQVADWLPRQAPGLDIRHACETAVASKSATERVHLARCIAFFPALGGVGNTTLALAAADYLANGKKQPNAACLIDLDLQSGSLADFLDLPPNLQLDDIAVVPERLDGHLLEVMLSRHDSGLALLAAPNSLTGLSAVGPDLIARMLDHAAAKFDNIIIDLPRLWQPWSENVLKGADCFYIVTELSVPGLRQARRLADELQQRFDMPSKGRVIVNKMHWLGRNGVKKRDAFEALGDRLAGFVRDGGNIVAQAHNRGVPLSELKRSNRVAKDLAVILNAS